jgi:large subunit ribosomal protein L21e
MQSLGKMLHKYDLTDKVVIKIDSGFHKGMPHHRYFGKVGVVTERRGRAYVIELKEGGVTRKLIVRPEHLVPYLGDKANAKDIG